MVVRIGASHGGAAGVGLPPPSVAVTSPSNGFLLVGSSITISGTCDAGCTVEVYKAGSTFIGNAVVVGTVWTYTSYTLVSGDDGVISITAVAKLHGQSTTSAAATSLVLGPSSLDELWKSTSGVGQTSNLVDTWTGMLNGIVLSNTGGSARPTYNAADATLNNRPSLAGDGVAKYLRTTAYAPPRPGTAPSLVLMVMKQNAFASGRRFYGSGSSNNIYTCLTSGASPNVAAFNGNTPPDNGGLAIGSWKRFGAYYSNSAADYTYCGATKVTGLAGNSLPSGNFTLFASGLIALFSNISIAEVSLLKRDLTLPEWDAFAAYCGTEYVGGMT